VLALLEVHILLQLDAGCITEVKALHALMANTPTKPKDLAWWEGTFLPHLIEAFSCNAVMHPSDDNVDPSFLPRDIRATFATDRYARKLWRLHKAYLSSAQKQR